jgi:hypothetical protein
MKSNTLCRCRWIAAPAANRFGAKNAERAKTKGGRSPFSAVSARCARIPRAWSRPSAAPWSLVAALAAGMLAPAPRVSAGERAYYECTLQEVLLSARRSVVFLFALEDGQVRAHGCRTAEESGTICLVKGHGLKVDSGRLRGPLRIQAGGDVERIELDVTLDKGGTYTVAYAWPGVPEKVHGSVAVEPPADAAGKRWVVVLLGGLGPGRALDLAFNVDREGKTLQALPASARDYNTGKYPVDAAKLAFDGTTLDGEIGVTIVPDAWVPAHKQPLQGRIKLKASLDGKDKAGTYSAAFDMDKRRQGQASVKAATAAQLRDLVGPVLSPQAPWRVFLVCGQQGRDRRMEVERTPSPPADWAQADFDDSGWGRYMTEVFALFGGYGFGQSPASKRLCLRTRFGVADPAQARDLTLSLEYRGGVVAYVNGREVARQHLPKGRLDANAVAEAYPPEAFVDPGGAPLPRADRPAAAHRDRYERRIRKLTAPVPASVLRKGANTLAIELHAAPTDTMQAGGAPQWGAVGLCDVKLSSPTGAGLLAFDAALEAVTVANATPLDMISTAPCKQQTVIRWGNDSMTQVALSRGNPFDPLMPVRAVAPRGGTCSGQVVVSGPGPLTGLRAAIGPLRRAGGAETIPADLVRVCYATQDKDEVFCNALMPAPADGPAVQPVWVLVDVPRDQPPGWYTGALAVTAGGSTTDVPVQVLVAGWTLTDPKDNATLVCLYQSPDTLAAYYRVDPWSDKHFALIEKSLRSMALSGNDVLLVPVILDNYLHHKTGMVRWVLKGGGHEPEYAAFERYLDLHTKAFGKPKVVTLSIWKHDFGTRTWFRGMKSDVVKPCRVTEFDPKTGKMQPMQAPHFGEPGSEEFWKTMIEGVRRIIKARGCDDRFLLLGEPFDSRPLEPHRKFFETIEPTMRWQIYSHFDGGEPPVKDGKWVVHGGFEVGFRINPNGGSLPEFDRAWPKAPAHEFLLAQCQRWVYLRHSSLLSYRLVMGSGTIARVGLDFWPVADERGRRRTFYSCPPNEGWLWRGHVPDLVAPGPDGAVRTTRAQMFLEGLQETELQIALIRAKLKASPQVADRIERRLAERRLIGQHGSTLSQAMISLDLPGMAAREYALAAELAGERGDGDWQNPPPAHGVRR